MNRHVFTESATMNGIHGMGAMDGFGPFKPEPNEPAVHGDWGGRLISFEAHFGSTGISRRLSPRIRNAQCG